MQFILSAVFFVYMVVAGLFALYFNWVYASVHGFISWIFFGEIIATLQGLLWPLYFIAGG